MVIAVHSSTPSQRGITGEMTENTNNKILEYAKNYKKEWLFIRGINKSCETILLNIENNTDYEKVFSSPGVKTLVRNFRRVLSLERLGRLKNIRELKFNLSDVNKIIELRICIYTNIGLRFPLVFNFDEDFQYLFENLIMFTNMCKIKNEEDFEDDLYSIFEGDNINDSESDESDIDSFSESDESDSFSESDESDSFSESDESDQ